MSVHRFGDIAFISGGNAPAIVISRQANGMVTVPGDKKTFSSPKPQDEQSSLPWAIWGEDNQLPNRVYAKYVENTGVLSSGTDIISRIAIGRGPRPVQVTKTDTDGGEEVKMIDDPDINQWLTDNSITTFSYDTILDALQTGHTFTQCLANRAGTRINRMKRTDAAICRFGKRNQKGQIKKVFMSYEWDRVSSAESEYVESLPLLSIANPVGDILDDAGAVKLPGAEFMIASHYRLFSRQYYAATLWWSVRKWCDIAMGVPEMKAYMFNNQMTLKYVIEIDDRYWSSRWKGWSGFTQEDRDAKRKVVFEEMDKFLASNENAYKSWITGRFTDPATGKTEPFVKIMPLEDLIKEGKLLPDSAAANSEILFAIALNPALLGVDMPGGMYSGGKGGSNIREAFMVQILIREVEREFVVKPLNVVARVNGWTEKYPGLQWRFPNHYLTTLDSGKNAKPIM